MFFTHTFRIFLRTVFWGSFGENTYERAQFFNTAEFQSLHKMPYVISAKQLKDIIDDELTEIVLEEVPVENLKECVGFTYRWLSVTNANVKVTYLPSNQTVATGINADLKFLKKCMERNPSKYYWLDCICVPQDEKLPAKEKEIFNMRTYYSLFKRVAFIGRLDGTSHDGNFKVVIKRLFHSDLLRYK